MFYSRISRHLSFYQVTINLINVSIGKLRVLAIGTLSTWPTQDNEYIPTNMINITNFSINNCALPFFDLDAVVPSDNNGKISIKFDNISV